METSDFLTILGLAIAVWTLIPNKERRFILLFFSKIEIYLLLLSLIFIHYLMAFDWLLANWFPSLSIFINKKGLPSETWSYVISLFVITYPIIKVSLCYFSKSRLNNLIELYETYLKEDEIDLLVNFINKYHINDIQLYLHKKSALPDKDPMYIVRQIQTIKDKEYEKLVKPKRILFAV